MLPGLLACFVNPDRRHTVAQLPVVSKLFDDVKLLHHLVNIVDKYHEE
jgi:hypothetical protein